MCQKRSLLQDRLPVKFKDVKFKDPKFKHESSMRRDIEAFILFKISVVEIKIGV